MNKRQIKCFELVFFLDLIPCPHYCDLQPFHTVIILNQAIGKRGRTEENEALNSLYLMRVSEAYTERE